MKTLLLVTILFLSSICFGQSANQSILKGNQLYQQSQFELAEAQYRKALEYDPENEKAKYNLANALHRQKKYDEAIKVLGDLTNTSNDQQLKSAAFYNQGVAQSRLKETASNQTDQESNFLDQSIDSYKKALRLNPNDQQARENLQKALLQKKKQQQSSQQKKSQSNMSQKEAQQKLDMLSQKEKQLHQRKDKQQEGSGQAQDW